MTSLIKNQILKHLSKFAKNLSHDQIHLSALKGEGELTNLELNDEVLTELLELPSWLRLSSATCNKVQVRIQWTKLKSVPIHLYLDEVRVEVETCEDLRPTSNGISRPTSALSGGSHYGFSDKVVDGISLSVNSVHLTLKSHAFVASIQLSRILVESKSPTWQKADLRMTRVKDTDKGELLIFKELSWQTVRIEAKSTKNEDLTPLRLITNQARCRITIKKRLADCTVLGCRLVLILDDLLWVLTDDQLKAALHFADSLSGLLKRATEETQKIKGARKLESLSVHTNANKDSATKRKTSVGNDAAKVFARYDVIETSYHLYSDRIDLHLCDDPGGMGRSCHPRLGGGGAFQVSLSKLQVDFYPYHLASGDRSAWIRYQESIHAAWLENSLNAFQARLLDALLTAARNIHTPLTRSNMQQSATQPKPAVQADAANTAQIKSALMNQFGKLMTTNLVVRLNNFTMWKVSTSKAKVTPKEFLSGDRKRYSLPDDMNVMHFEYTEFYYPGDKDFPLPAPKLFAYFNPIQLSMDPITILWLNAFALNLQRSVKKLSVEQTEPPYLDVKVEAIMFRMVVEASEEEKQAAAAQNQSERPQALHLQASRIVAANYRSHETGSKADLAKSLNSFQDSELFFGTNFPNAVDDIPVVCDKMVRHATGSDDVRPSVDLKLPSLSHQDWWPVMKKDLLWTDAKDVWFVSVDPLWADFHGVASAENRAVPFIDAFPLNLWLYKEDVDLPSSKKMKQDSGKTEMPLNAKMHLLVQVSSLISLQLSHFQFLFLMRVLETVSEITTFLTQDVSHILGEEDESSVAFALVAPQVDISLLMPHGSGTQPKDNPIKCPPAPEKQPSLTNVFQTKLNIESQRNTLCSPSDISESATSAPVSPSKSRPEVIHSADSVPEIRNLTSNNPVMQTRIVSNPRPPMTPPTINLPIAIPGSEPVKRSKAFKPFLASSLSNKKAQLDSFRPSSSSSSLAANDDDSLSVMSDDSDTSESYVVVNQGDASGREVLDSTLFAIHSSNRGSPVEMATEVTEDISPCESLRSDAPTEIATMGVLIEENAISELGISVATFHVGRIELAQQSVGRHSCIKVQAASLSGEECPETSWDEFQAKFATRSKGWSDSTRQPPSTWCFKLRFSTSAPDYSDILRNVTLDKASMTLKEKISRATNAFVDLKVKNLPLQFYSSTVAGLADLFEDEIIPSAIPMQIELENLALRLIEDRPSPNSSSPGSLPIDLAIPSLVVIRETSGLFSIQPSGYSPNTNGLTTNLAPAFPEVSRPKSSAANRPHMDLIRCGITSSTSIEAELQHRASLLAVDNAGLRTQLENANAEVKNLRSRLQELDSTRVKLVKVQQQALALDKENKSMKETLRYLQEELVKTGKRNMHNS